MTYFTPASRDAFRSNYPEVPHKLAHTLRNHPLLQIEALARLGEALPPAQVEYNHADLAIGITDKPAPSGLTIGETIRGIETSRSWAALKNIEHAGDYRALLLDLLAELRPDIESRTGAMLQPQGFIFVTSPGGVTPYHFDPEHNILLQLRGTKVMTQFPAGDPRYAPDEVHERYHTGGPRELTWTDELAAGGRDFALVAGDALFVPVMAPHYVRNGPEVSVSLSITWRSSWSFAEAEARAFNAFLRRRGFTPRQPGRWPHRNTAKSVGWKILRRMGVAAAHDG